MEVVPVRHLDCLEGVCTNQDDLEVVIPPVFGLEARVFRAGGLGITKLGFVHQSTEIQVIDEQEMDDGHVPSLPFAGEVVPNLITEFGKRVLKAFIGRFAGFLKRDAFRGHREVAQQIVWTFAVLEVEACP